MTFKLRSYQRAAIDAIKQDWQDGYTDVLLTAATGSGKTTVFLQLLDEVLQDGQRALILSHRRELVDQPYARLAEFWPHRKPHAGIVMAQTNEAWAQIVIATVQTLQSEKRLGQILRSGPIDYLVIDECFPAGTLVDGHPIETIKVGDWVTAWDETTGRVVPARVTRLFKNPAPDILYEIATRDCRIVCTAGHPIYTDSGWKPAMEVTTDDTVFVSVSAVRIPRQDPAGRTATSTLASSRDEALSRMLRGSAGVGTRSAPRSTQAGENSLSPLRGTVQQKESWRPCGLCTCPDGRTDEGNAQDGYAKAQSKHGVSALLVGAHEEEQPDARWDCSAQNGAHAQAHRARTEAKRGQRARPHRTTKGAMVGTWPRMDSGTCHTDKGTQGAWVSDLLQGRSGTSRQADRRGSGWWLPLQPGAAETGSEERTVLARKRVESVQILQRGCTQEFERLCPDGHVYNLEVEHFHTYIANGIVVHNCHHAVANSYRNIIAALKDVNPNLRHVGVTATPIRADEVGLRTVYQKESAHYGIKELVKLGYLAPPRWLAIQTGISLAGIRSQGSGSDRDFNQKQLANVYETANCFDLVVETHKRYAADRMCMAFTVSVAGAYELAEAFNRAGIAAAALDGTTSREERRKVLSDFRAGQYQVLANCALLTEGVDVPEVSCIHQVRPTQSDSLYTQIIGRALRTFPGKSDALILDYCPLDSRNIAMLGDVLGVEAKKEAYVEKKDDPGEVVAGFTFDGNVNWLAGNPMEIVSRQLDYLAATPWRWSRPDGKTGPMVLGLGPGNDEIDRTLVISPPAEQMDVWLVAKRENERWHRAYHVMSGTFEQCSEWANTYADERGNAVLARKQAAWRNSLPSEGQVKFARRLGVYRDGMSKGEVADAITCKLALEALRRKGAAA